MESNMIGAYGPWAAGLVEDGPARLSFRDPRVPAGDVDGWRARARQRLKDCLMQPSGGSPPKPQLQHALDHDGLRIEHLSWQLPYGPPTEAVVLKPVGARGRLPAVLALHDHGGNKYFGWRKIAQIGESLHPMMKAHRNEYYGGVSWANELAKRGFVVLVHDAFAFASRRVRAGDLPPVVRKDLQEVSPESEDEIKAYNGFAADHEGLMAKSLFCAGTTWPGVFTSEDQRALDYLCSREDVDPGRVGCGGLSGGGLRTVYLAGLDDRIRCACCVGMMTTWRDYLLNKCHTPIPGWSIFRAFRKTSTTRKSWACACRCRPWCRMTTTTISSPSAKCTAPIASWPKSTPRRAPATDTKRRFTRDLTSSTGRCRTRRLPGSSGG